MSGTYAPAPLLAVRDYAYKELKTKPGGFGIVAGAAHVSSGYHCGISRLLRGKGLKDYSAVGRRDRAALRGPTREAACAFDIDRSSRQHRQWVARLVADLREGADYTLDIRAVNATLDGRTAFRWDREARFKQVVTDDSHLWHTHVEFYRDAIAAGRPQIEVLRRFYTPRAVLVRRASGPATMSIRTPQGSGGRATWAQLLPAFYADHPKDVAGVKRAGSALRQANIARGDADGSGKWETVGPRVTVSVPARLYY